MLLKMPYAVGSFKLDGASNKAVTFQSSLYHPAGSGGHQPHGFDQWAALYEENSVSGVKFSTYIVNLSATTPVYMGSLLSQNPVFPYSTLTAVLEDPTCAYKVVSAMTGGEDAQWQGRYWKPWDSFGYSHEEYKDNADTKGDWASDPIIMGYIHWWVWSCDTVSELNCMFDCRAIIYAELAQPKQITPS